MDSNLVSIASCISCIHHQQSNSKSRGDFDVLVGNNVFIMHKPEYHKPDGDKGLVISPTIPNFNHRFSLFVCEVDAWITVNGLFLKKNVTQSGPTKEITLSTILNITSPLADEKYEIKNLEFLGSSIYKSVIIQ